MVDLPENVTIGAERFTTEENQIQTDEPPENRVTITHIPRIESPVSSSLEAHNRISRWMKKEKNKLLEFADEPQTFLKQAESFYETSTPTIDAICADIGCANWKKEHWEAVLTASECPAELLYSSIRDLTTDWPTVAAAELSGITCERS